VQEDSDNHLQKPSRILRFRAATRLLTRSEKGIYALFVVLLIASGIYLGGSISRAYSVPVPANGGTLREGIIGIPRFINPLLAVSNTDRDMTALTYAGLMRLDSTGTVIPNLAEDYTISEDGIVYTFHIRKDARFSDGTPVTADDVIFTISLATNPSYRSPLRANWEGVATEKIDDYTVQFTLAKPYAPFLENTTVGILPRHIWSAVSAEEFTLTPLNIEPIGAGPFRVVSLEKNSTGGITTYILEANTHYVLGTPLINTLELHFFPSPEELLLALENRRIDSASAVPPSAAAHIHESFPILRLPLSRVFGLFLNQNTSKTLTDDVVRDALELSIDKNMLVANVLEGEGTPAYGPIPPETFGALDQDFYSDRAFDLERAKQLLTDNDWIDIDEDGIRDKKISKDETIHLSFTISTSDTPDLVETARLLQTMWNELGAKVEISVFEIGDFEQNVLRPRRYDAVLFGQAMAHDPDPFAFWHSSQRNDPGLNIAMYTNPRVDTLLTDAHALPSPEEREEKYRTFGEYIATDMPALFLYSPYYLYVPASSVHNISIKNVVLPSDRFTDIHTWYIKTKNVWQTSGM